MAWRMPAAAWRACVQEAAVPTAMAWLPARNNTHNVRAAMSVSGLLMKTAGAEAVGVSFGPGRRALASRGGQAAAAAAAAAETAEGGGGGGGGGGGKGSGKRTSATEKADKKNDRNDDASGHRSSAQSASTADGARDGAAGAAGSNQSAGPSSFDYKKVKHMASSASGVVFGALKSAAGAVVTGVGSVRDEVAKDINNIIRPSQGAGPSPSASASGRSKGGEADGSKARDGTDTGPGEEQAPPRVEGNILGVLRGAPRGPLSSSTTVMLSSAQSSSPVQTVVEWLVRNGALSPDSPILKQSKVLLRKSSEIVDKTKDKIGDYTEGIQERWETSESPVVHYVQDKLDGLGTVTDAATCIQHIRMYDPSFDTVDFLNLLRKDVGTVLRSFLTDDKATLSAMCASDFSVESVQNALMQDDFSKLKRDGYTIDSKILDVGDVDMLSMEMIDATPHILVRVNSQQIECIRDRSGKVVRGAPDDIRSVFYVWGVQMTVGEEGEDAGRPRWLLRAVQLQGNISLPA